MKWLKKMFGSNENMVSQDTATENHASDTTASKKATKEATKEVTKVYHLIVIDESGSMSTVRQEVVSGCNETLQTIRVMKEKNTEQEHLVSIYMFQTGSSRYVIKETPIGNVRNIRPKDYRPGTCTPLYDAVGDTLTDLKSELAEDVAAYVTIITDGYENDSRRYNAKMVKNLINKLKKKKVIFSFIGANIDSKQYGHDMGIDNTLQFTADQRGTQEMWERERMAKMRSSSRMKFNRMHMDEEGRSSFYEEENRGDYYRRMDDRSRFTPEHVTRLRPHEIFVFGSNTKGMHSDGAAGYARKNFGAVYGQAEGLQGQSYAIPTAGVSLNDVYEAVQRFTEFAQHHPEYTFLVTAVGCGNAGWDIYDIAPMFGRAASLGNVKLPSAFWNMI